MLDTPVVNIAFDGHDEKPFLDSSRRFYQYTHYKPLVDVGAVRVAAIAGRPDGRGPRLPRRSGARPGRAERVRHPISATAWTAGPPSGWPASCWIGWRRLP